MIIGVSFKIFTGDDGDADSTRQVRPLNGEGDSDARLSPMLVDLSVGSAESK